MIQYLIFTVLLYVVPPAWFCWLVRLDPNRPTEHAVPSPEIVFGIPDLTCDWRGLI